MPEETSLKQYAKGGAILATDLNATNRQVEELARQVNALQKLLANGGIEMVPLEQGQLEVDGLQGVYLAKTIVRGEPDLEATNPDINSIGVKPDDSDAVLWDTTNIDGAVLGRYLGRRKSDGKLVFLTTNTNGVEVDLTQTGGTAGVAKVSYCTYTYTAKFAGSDITVGTALSPASGFGRGLKIALSAATTGRGYFSNGAFVLVLADEKPSGEQDCS